MNLNFTRFLLPLLLFSVLFSAAQAPANDNCANASPVIISNNGYGLGTFTSAQADLTNATVEPGETFYSTISSAGENKKSVWYSFYLPTARYCTLTLDQPSSLIASNDVGFTVYKTNTCFPNTAEADSALLAAQSVFGHSTNPCLKPGYYLVQVSSNFAADGPIFITLLLDNPSPASYDGTDSATAYNFGVPSSCQNYVDFATGCQTVFDSTESCPALGPNYLDWTQSIWLTFTTPSYIDWAQVLIGPTAGCCFNNNPGATFAYNLYKGDQLTTPISALTLIDGPVVDTFTNYGPWFQREYECELDTSTRYSIQIFFNKTFADNVRVYLDILGVAPTAGSQPTTAAVAPANILGVLPGGNGSTFDYWGCNSRFSQNVCGQTNPAGGVTHAGINYTLNDWFTFQVGQPSNMYFNIYNNGNAPFVRIFKKDINASCNNIDTLADLYTQFVSTTSLTCVQPGTYSMQVMGRDDDPQWGCAWRDNLGQRLNVTYSIAATQAFNHYSLDVPGAVDTVNNVANAYAPIQQGVNYNTGIDTFGCDNTVMPAGTHCNDPDETKAIYYQFLVGDANGDGVPDSGVITFAGNFSWNYWQTGNILYQGDANSLSTAQVAHLSGDTINGLSKATLCFGNGGCAGPRACVTPGMYTLVTFGDSTIVGQSASWSVSESLVTTVYHSAALAENMGSVIDSIAFYGGTSVNSLTDHFSCLDNPDSIGGLGPCPLAYGNPATKLIYRQFYLSAPALATITSSAAYTCSQAGTLTLFYGEATNGIATLTPVGGPWTCFTSTYTGPCTPLPAGWYTVVAYGEGPTYGSPATNYNGNRGYGGDIGYPNYITVNITQAPPGPVYDHPFKACIDTTTHLPFLIQPTANRNTTNDYPVTDTTYNLYQENYNCTTDTPWTLQSVVPCTNTYQPNRVTYYVFTVPNMAYLHIYGMNGAMCEVFPFDVRTDSAQMLTTQPVQPCNSNGDYTQLCRLVAGTYTLVIFPPDNFAGSNIRPSIYVDSVGYSRFDNAVNAYDFGTIPMDSTWYSGMVGDVNPLDANRAASDDFFYCTTGAQANDPTANACYVAYDPLLYNSLNNDYAFDAAAPGNGYNVPRRNLWYTFELDKGGTCYVKVNNMTPDKTSQYPFAIYKSDVNGALTFPAVVASGQVDSTLPQGLTSINSNYYYYCGYYNEISFYRSPCGAIKERYYIVVDNPNNMEPNSQVEVNILYDTINTSAPLYDHYSQANVINGLNQVAPPYTQQPLDTGIWLGGTDNFTCATQDSLDPNPCNCAQKNLWYKFTVNETGLIRLRYLINGANVNTVDGCQLTWYREVVPGDSTTHGLANLPGVQYNYYDAPTNTEWYQTCITAGTYYILMTGCNRTDETVQPVVWFIDQHGDYCSDPIAGTISAAGSINMSAIVDCHSIGGDFGEDGSNMGCLIPNGDSIPQFKSTWYRFTITGPDTFDITPVLTDNTNVPADQIRYRMLYGTCNAMNPGSCFVSASTVNTFNCMTQGSYYIQVVEPANQFGYPFGQVTGTIDVQINAAPAQPGCIPVSNCFVVANWISNQSCANDSVFFVNQSTEGDSIRYHWDFGEGDTSNIKNPVFAFPTPNLTQSYSVLLTVTNTACNKQDSLRQTIVANQQPVVNLPADTTLCPPLSLVLHATTWPGATYLWQDGNTDSVYNVTAGGTYTVIDSFNNCKVSKTIVIGTGTQPTLNLGPDQALCAGMSYQSNITTSPGETFLWNTGSTSPSFTTDSAGAYSVTATLGTCIARDTINISNLANSRPFGSDTNLCTGTTLTLNATTFGASGYLWNDGATNPVKTISTPGLYFVKITVSNCFVIDSINAISVTSPAPYITGDSALCAPGDSAAMDAGAGYTTYRWSTGDSTETITVGSPATYRVTVTNAGGCTGIDSFIVRQSSPITLTAANTNVSCFGGNNGAIQLTVNGGTPGYAYLWSSLQTTPNISNLMAGNYAVAVKDAIGCTATLNDTINQPAALADSVVVTPVICFGQSNGTASVIVSGGTGQDVFNWSNSANTENITGLAAGIYQVTVTDSLLCTITAGAVIVQPAALQLALTDTNITCAGFNNGKISTTVQGGITPYTYLWTGGLTTANISNLPPATYTVTVTDSNSCTITGNATITTPLPLQLSIQTVNVLCSGNNTGSITATLSGGTGAYNYLWSNAATTAAIAQLIAGSYTITGTDANNCTVDTSIVITQPAPLVITVDSSIAPSCYGYADGSIYTTESGGVTPYTLSWSNTSTASNITNLANGTYTLTFTDSDQCSVTNSVTITSPDSIVITPTLTDVSCFGKNDGNIKTVVTGGTTPYAYLWSNAVTTPQISNLAPGIYSVTVTDAHNCTGTDTGLVIKQPAALADSLSVSNETCPVAKNGAVISNVTGGTAAYTYNWSNGANTQNIINIHAGTYALTVNDHNGCSVTATATVIIQPTLILEATVDNPLCPPLQDGSITLVVGGNTNPYQYHWSGAQQGASPSNLSPGSYAVTVTDQYGCTIDSSFTLQYQFVLTLQATPSFTTIKLGQLVQLATATNGTQLHYQWTPQEGLTCSDCAAPVASPTADTHYTVTGQDNNGCIAVDTIDINVIPDYDLFIPNAFTPNNDGNNDFFEIFGNKAAMRYVAVEVFDRWGEKVFESNSPDFQWDGTYKGKAVQPGVFVYAIQVSFSDGHSDKLFKGSVTLIR